VDQIYRLIPTFDGGDDFIGIGGPHEGFGVIVGFLQEAVDGGLEIDNRAEGTAFEAAVGQLSKEAFGSRVRITDFGTPDLLSPMKLYAMPDAAFQRSLTPAKRRRDPKTPIQIVD
jgi:hypothetical protein